MVSETANSGIGLWTAICSVFCSLAGKESKAVRKKRNGVLNLAIERLNNRLMDLDAKDYSDYRVVWNGLCVTVSVMATIDVDTCLECGAEIEKNASFCGNCGKKIS